MKYSRGFQKNQKISQRFLKISVLSENCGRSTQTHDSLFSCRGAKISQRTQRGLGGCIHTFNRPFKEGGHRRRWKGFVPFFTDLGFLKSSPKPPRQTFGLPPLLKGGASYVRGSQPFKNFLILFLILIFLSSGSSGEIKRGIIKKQPAVSRRPFQEVCSVFFLRILRWHRRRR